MNGTSKPHRPLNIVCDRAHWDFVLESYFFREVLLGGLQRPLRIIPLEPDQIPPSLDDLLIAGPLERLKGLIDRAIQTKARNVGVFHMADECFDLDRSFYPNVDYVIRNYFRADILALPQPCRCMQVLWVPNGYRHGIGARSPQSLTPFPARQHQFFFAGQMNPSVEGQRERAAMFEALQQSRLPALVMRTDRFAAGLGPASYSAFMENSRFALCPRGNSQETIRLFDAMELGAIPISLRHDFLLNPKVMGGTPIVLLDRWEQLPHWYAQAIESPDAENIWHARQTEMVQWWSAFKSHKQAEVAALIEQSFARYQTL
ncbi:MAG TPA: exostosin family protein [Humisphaera sp.]|nr:exostosin family protein [Humisphaera sp.]